MASATTKLLSERENIELKDINPSACNSSNTTVREGNISKIYTCVHCDGGTDLDALSDIINAGRSDINYTDEKNRTALHEAVRKDELETVKLLMEAGAMLEIKDRRRGNTALHDVYDVEFPKKSSGEIFKTLFPVGRNVENIRENTNKSSPQTQKCRCHQRSYKQAWFDAATSTNLNGENVLDLILRKETLTESKREIVRYLINETDDIYYLMRLFRNTPRSPNDPNSDIEIGKPLKTDENSAICSPFRRLIHIFPEVIPDLMNRCITKSTGKVNYHFELLDDVFLLHTWPPKQEHYCMWLYQYPWEHIDEKEKKGRGAYSDQLSIIRNNHPLMLMVKHKNNKALKDKKEVYKQMIDHPLVKTLIRYKWLHMGRKFHIFSFVLYLIFLMTLSTFVITIDSLLMEVSLSDTSSTTENASCCIYSTICNTTYICQNSSFCQSTTFCYNTSSVNVSTTQNASADVSCDIHVHVPSVTVMVTVLVCLMVIFILKELYYIIMTYGREYFKVLQNYVKWTSYGALIGFLITTLNCEDKDYRTTWHWIFGSIAIFLAWVDVLSYVEKFDTLGMYVSMLKRITITFLLNVFPLVVIFLIAFALAFFCVRKHQDQFKDVVMSLLTTSALMADGFGYDDISKDDFDAVAFVSILTSSLFLIMMTIIIMNLMIGVAVSDVQKVHDQAEEQHSTLQIEHILALEIVCHAFIKVLMVCKCTRKCAKWLRAKFIQEPKKSVLIGRTELEDLPNETNDKEFEHMRQQLEELTSVIRNLSREDTAN